MRLGGGRRARGYVDPQRVAFRHEQGRAAVRFGTAIRRLSAILADRERSLGVDHPETLIARDHLAFAYCEAGRVHDAIPILQMNRAIRERNLGPVHPHVFDTDMSLAGAFLEAGRAEEAVSTCEVLWIAADGDRGSTETVALIAGNNHAYACLKAGDLDAAVRLYEGTFAQCERVLGKRHKLTKLVKANLTEARRPSRS